MGVGGGAAVLLVALALTVSLGADDRSSAHSGARRVAPTTKPRSGQGRPRVTSSSTAASSAPSASATEPDTATPNPDSTPSPAAAQAAITLAENPGGCTWDEGTHELKSSGTLTNMNADGYTVEVSVDWLAGDGTSLGSAADLWFVGAGGDPVDWALANGDNDAPSGVRCEVSTEVLY